MDARTARGLDGISGLVKNLGDIARDTLPYIFTWILTGEPVPADWQCGRVCLVRKKGGDASLLQDYRPITVTSVTSVVYRLFTLVMNAWLSAWAERSCALTELQNCFRSNRCLEDNLFTLGQTIEPAQKESRGLVACFLDVAKAYESVPHELMLSGMSALKMSPQLVDILTFADDLVLLVDNIADLQHLVTLSTTHLARLDLAFNPKKSAVLQFSGEPEAKAVPLTGNNTIPWATECARRTIATDMPESQRGDAPAYDVGVQPVRARSRNVEAVRVPALTFADAVFRQVPERGWRAHSRHSGYVDFSSSHAKPHVWLPGPAATDYRHLEAEPCGARSRTGGQDGTVTLVHAWKVGLGALQFAQVHSDYGKVCFDTSTTEQSAICRACGEAQESALHVVTQCVELAPAHPDDTSFPQALGFEAQDGGALSSVVVITKERLRNLEKVDRGDDRRPFVL
ncbi:hypothetical protein HPB50_000789 [Hyalomma asiaticum]|uniref:Uncharacterized protein n=1 Tax=Hyalomma asiaticum TaxID=266040 RepID=A0ACB7TGI7_HYAAI|nr:hypothetical protein HPB50_000789 [Hyalomma asiaticum]